jgi:thiol-disulfide isomerase/thioredoxin
MSLQRYQHGISLAGILILLAAAILLVGIGVAAVQKIQSQPEEATVPTTITQTSAIPHASTVPRAPSGPTTYTGSVLAGTSSPLLDFNATDFAAAKASNKLIVLYFYADWCPICAEEFPKMQAAFNSLTTDQVVGFRVNFNDDETDATEEALAREHGVAYQHTKVFIKNGQRSLKSPETWDQSRYTTEITNAL